jgi:hypothetical protein
MQGCECNIVCRANLKLNESSVANQPVDSPKDNKGAQNVNSFEIKINSLISSPLRLLTDQYREVVTF